MDLMKSTERVVLAYNAELRGLANYYSIATSAKIEMRNSFVWPPAVSPAMARKRGTTVTRRRHLFSNGRWICGCFNQCEGDGALLQAVSTGILNDWLPLGYGLVMSRGANNVHIQQDRTITAAVC